MRRAILIGCALCLLSSLAFAVPSVEDIIRKKGLPRIDAKQTTIDFMTVWVSGASADKEAKWLSEDLKKDYPMLDVKIEKLGTNPLKEAATTRVIAGMPPTLAHISGGYAIDEFIRQGVLLDVTSYWKTYNLESVVSPTLAGAFKYNGKYYGFPLSDAPQALLYWNKDVFKAAGVPQPPYASWDDFFKAAEIWKKAKPGVPFYAYGLNPGWYGLERALVQAATMYGKDYIFRIYNGEATVEDYANLLAFNKKLIAVSNADFASLEGTQGVQEIVTRGDAGLCYSGSWGAASFEKANIKEGKNLGYSLLPGNKMTFTTISGYVVFAKSGKEAAGAAIGLHAMLKDTQKVLNISKDNIPARKDIAMDKADGWSNLVTFIYNQMDDIEVIPRANTGLPSMVLTDMAPIFTSAMTGKMPADEAAKKLKALQDQNKDNYQFIRW